MALTAITLTFLKDLLAAALNYLNKAFITGEAIRVERNYTVYTIQEASQAFQVPRL